MVTKRMDMLEAFAGLRSIYRMFDDAGKALEAGIGRPVCYAGCGRCCEVNVPYFTTIEAINAVSMMRGLGRMQIIDGLAEGWLTEQSSRATIYQGIPKGELTPELHKEAVATACSKCPFLAPDKSCMIYEARPLACRGFNVTRDGSEICPRPLGKGESANVRMTVDGSDIRREWLAFREEAYKANPVWTISGNAPAMLLRASKPERFRALVLEGKIPSAKLVGTEMDAALAWQPQLDAMKRGETSPQAIVNAQYAGGR